MILHLFVECQLNRRTRLAPIFLFWQQFAAYSSVLAYLQLQSERRACAHVIHTWSRCSHDAVEMQEMRLYSRRHELQLWAQKTKRKSRIRALEASAAATLGARSRMRLAWLSWSGTAAERSYEEREQAERLVVFVRHLFAQCMLQVIRIWRQMASRSVHRRLMLDCAIKVR